MIGRHAPVEPQFGPRCRCWASLVGSIVLGGSTPVFNQRPWGSSHANQPSIWPPLSSIQGRCPAEGEMSPPPTLPLWREVEGRTIRPRLPFCQTLPVSHLSATTSRGIPFPSFAFLAGKAAPPPLLWVASPGSGAPGPCWTRRRGRCCGCGLALKGNRQGRGRGEVEGGGSAVGSIPPHQPIASAHRSTPPLETLVCSCPRPPHPLGPPPSSSMIRWVCAVTRPPPGPSHPGEGSSTVKPSNSA